MTTLRPSRALPIVGLLAAAALAAKPAGPRAGWDFKFKDFVVGAWWGPRAVDAELKLYKEAGFNVVMAGRYMQLDHYGDANRVARELDLARKHGLAVLLDTYTKNDRPWGGRPGWIEPHPTHHAASLVELKWLHERVGKHPALIGYLLGDDHSALTRRLADGTGYLRKAAPQLMPWICQNAPNAKSLAAHGNPILNVQIYPTLYRRRLPAAEQARLYCTALAKMRRDSRELGLFMWPMINISRPDRSPSGFAHLQSDSLVRFPVFASLAYGAQGLWYFTYSGGSVQAYGKHETEQQVRRALTPLYPVVKRANLRIAAWAPRLLGRSAAGLFATAWPGRKSLAGEGLIRPGRGKLIEGMSDDLLVGILTKAGRPPLAMVVDCRASKGFGDLRARAVDVRFHAAVEAVAPLEGKAARPVQGRVLRLKLDAGDGQLVELRGRRLAPLAAPKAIYARPAAGPAGPRGRSGSGGKEAAVRPKLDVPPTPRQKPYSPAFRQQVAINPPPFIWVPAGRGAVYALQVSRSRDFPEGGTITFRDIRTSVFVPPKTLAPGAWYWRYGVRAGGSTVYGKARPFTVSADARAFPFPDFDEVIARVPRGRPRLFFPGRRLAEVRAWARGELKAAVDGMVRHCRRVVGRKLVAEPPRPRSGPERVHVMRTTRPPMDEMERCALAYLLTGEKRLGLEAKRRLMYFFAWDPNGPTALRSYDEPAMWVMMRGTRAYDWTHELFTPAERRKIEPVMQARAGQFLKHLKRRPFESDPYESHAGRMPGFLGEAALCFAHEWPEARRWLEYATLLYCTSYPAWGGDDGGWQEGPSYWSYYMAFALHYVVALREATGVDLMRKPFFRNTPDHGLYFATVYHEHRPFGDGKHMSPRSLGTVMYAFATLRQNPYFRWYWRESGRPAGRDLLTLATYDPKLRARNPKPLPPARAFPSAGLAAIHTALGDRDRDVTFLFRSSPFGSISHGHADQNAYVIEAFGRGLALATGYYPWYGSPHHQNWTRATRSVNSILVDGKGQVRRSWRAAGKITAFHTGGGYDYVEGEAGGAYGGRLKRFRRHVVHVRAASADDPPGGVFVMFDDLLAPRPATFQWLLHAHDRIGVEDGLLRVRRDPAVMDVHVLLPRGLKYSQSDAYDPDPEYKPDSTRWARTWHLAASTTRPAEAARFLTVFVVRRKEGKAPVVKVQAVDGKGAVGVRLTMPDGSREIVAFRTDAAAKEAECGGLRSEARVFAARRGPTGKTVRTLRIPNGT